MDKIDDGLNISGLSRPKNIPNNVDISESVYRKGLDSLKDKYYYYKSKVTVQINQKLDDIDAFILGPNNRPSLAYAGVGGYFDDVNVPRPDNVCFFKDDKAIYKPSPKHDPTSGWGSPNPIPDVETGQELLNTAYTSSKNKQLYNIYDGQLIKFQPDTMDGWHSYLVENPAKEVPIDVLRKMMDDGKITKSQYKNFIKNNRR